MTAYLQLRFTLKSDATFGRGDGVAGLVDEEIEHDDATGLPFLRGRTLKGLLVEECANIAFALTRSDKATPEWLEQASRSLFGNPGSTLDDDGLLHVGNAGLPSALHEAILADVKAHRISSADVLESLTAIRRQTAMSEDGAPDHESLRNMRVLLRGLTLYADLRAESPLTVHQRALLAACVLGLRRAGTGRNRGRGHLCDVQLHELTRTGETDITNEAFKEFTRLVKPTQETKQ